MFASKHNQTSFYINVVYLPKVGNFFYLKKSPNKDMLHIIIIIVCDKYTPNTSEVTCNFSKLFVTFGLDTLYVVWMLIKKNTAKLYVLHQLLFVLLFSMLISPTFRWVFVYEINNYPRLEFVKFVIFWWKWLICFKQRHFYWCYFVVFWCCMVSGPGLFPPLVLSSC